MPVLCLVDALCTRPENIYTVLVEPERQIVRNLSSYRHDDSVRLLKLVDVHDALECELVEIEPVAHVIVSGNRFGVVVDHNSPVAFLPDGVERIDGAPVELHGTSDAVGSGAEDYDGLAVMFVSDVVVCAVVCEVKIIGLGREFCGKGINLLYARHDAMGLPECTHNGLGILIVNLVLVDGPGNLEIRESLLLCPEEEVRRHCPAVVVSVHLIECLHDACQFLEKPPVNPGQLMDLVNSITRTHGL